MSVQGVWSFKDAITCLPLSFVKASFHLHHRARRHFVPTTEAPASRVCRAYFSFFIGLLLLLFLPRGPVCHRAEQVLLTGCDVQVRMHNGLAGHCYSLSSRDQGEIFCTGVNMCHLRCHCRASVKSPELKINQSANSQMSWSLIPKWLGLLSTFPKDLLLCFEMISLDSDVLLSEIMQHCGSIKNCFRLGLVSLVTGHKSAFLARGSQTDMTAF